jgi:cyclohexa-1,5-dienecarbonyl-CoA hydratase
LGEERSVHAVLLTAEGQSFCYGASIPEHAPGVVERMLPEFHALFRTISRAALPVVAAVRGKCLGGGLELALAAHRLVVAEDAELGFPEVTLGVFPPVAAALLPLRVPQPVVDRMVVLGDVVKGTDAVALGLADECAPSPSVENRALHWAARYRELSGTALRHATRASRTAWDEVLESRLGRLEHLYLDELMATADAREGIAAFLDRRPPRWSDA